MTTPTLREVAAGIVGALLMLVVTASAQIIDANDRQSEADQLRAEAVRAGFQEGIQRLICVAGLRYDTATGNYVDVKKVGPSK